MDLFYKKALFIIHYLIKIKINELLFFLKQNKSNYFFIFVKIF